MKTKYCEVASAPHRSLVLSRFFSTFQPFLSRSLHLAPSLLVSASTGSLLIQQHAITVRGQKRGGSKLAIPILRAQRDKHLEQNKNTNPDQCI